MRKARTWLAVIAASVLAIPCAAQEKKEFRYSLGTGASLFIVNDSGSISVRPSSNTQAIIIAKPGSKKVEVDGNQTGSRAVVRTHLLQRASAEESRVDYEVQLPPQTDVVLRNSDGAIIVERVNGDVTCEGESSTVHIRDGGNGHVHVRTVAGAINLTNLKTAHVELQSISGDIKIVSATGPSFTANSTKGNISYEGDFLGDGDYALTTHSGNIEVIMPSNASVELSARSVNGSVQDGFQLQPSKHPTSVANQGKSFAGTSNSGASSVKLRSFSGKITIKKK
jgi:DUF4097 and DUF4098 domain-containing protein YvlB